MRQRYRSMLVDILEPPFVFSLRKRGTILVTLFHLISFVRIGVTFHRFQRLFLQLATEVVSIKTPEFVASLWTGFYTGT